MLRCWVVPYQQMFFLGDPDCFILTVVYTFESLLALANEKDLTHII